MIFILYRRAYIKNACLWLIELSHTQYMSTGCVAWQVNGDVSMRLVISVHIIDSSPLTGENTLTTWYFIGCTLLLCMSNCMYNIGMVVKYTMHPL